jgi:2-iminoacetate synthase
MATACPTRAEQIIDERVIAETLRRAHAPDDTELDDILAKARELHGLNLPEAAVLLQASVEQSARIFAAAKGVKEAIYGKRMVLFAPLYTSNICVNDCLYCSFRRSNTTLHRKRLTTGEIARETAALERQGHKRMLLVLGEDPRVSIDEMTAAVQAVYAVREEGVGEIRRVNVNAAPMEPEAFRALKDAGIGTYQCFQETYHRETYAKMHPRGPKADFDYRMTVFDRAVDGGIDDLGLGALFGLYDPKFEVLALLMHAEYLDRAYGAGPHTISFPRLEPAHGAPAANDPPYKLTDLEVKLIVAVLRLAVPYTGIIMSTRETPAMRDELIHLGVSQLSAGSSTSPGGYAEHEDPEEAPQFELADHRSLDAVVRSLCESDFLPSFCTGCYRRGRTGHDFMDLARPGLIQRFCSANALLTFEEYLRDYASPATRAVGESLIARHLARMPDVGVRQWTEEHLARTAAGERDLYL